MLRISRQNVHPRLRPSVAEAAAQQQRVPALRRHDRRARHRTAAQLDLRLQQESDGK